MSQHLLAVTIGPVQDFIAAARRTRDFWYGSDILSEISKAVALDLSSNSELIFPAPAEPTAALAVGSPLNVANVILVVTRDGFSPDEAATKAKSIAMARWLDAAANARARVLELGGAALLNWERWDEQVDDVLEFYASWVKYDPGPDQYRIARQRVMRLLAGRKNCRNFKPVRSSAIGIPKSSLDGSRETLFHRGTKQIIAAKSLQRSIRLREGEQLDVIGLTKRLGGGKRLYPSVSRIAGDPWTRGAAKRCSEKLDTLISFCNDVQGLGKVEDRQFNNFPFEGAAIFANRLKDLQQELFLDEQGVEAIKLALDDIISDIGPPDPYLVVMAADGDGMGPAISSLSEPAAHQTFSRALSGFAGLARTVIRDHHGILVYAGGDDVLAFLPLDSALTCAQRLHDEFHDCISSTCGSILRSVPTLSIGLAIGHHLDPLEDLLNYARIAEKAAKGTVRDGLAIHYHPRNGAPVRVQGGWTGGLAGRMQTLTELHRDDVLGDKAGYDLRNMSRLYDGWESDYQSRAEILRADVERLLKRKKGRIPLREVAGVRGILEGVVDAAGLRELADEMNIARHLGAVTRQSGWSPSNSLGGISR